MAVKEESGGVLCVLAEISGSENKLMEIKG
jgi:hypothetical protein